MSEQATRDELARQVAIQDRKWRGRERHLRQLTGSKQPRRRTRGWLRRLVTVRRDRQRTPQAGRR